MLTDEDAARWVIQHADAFSCAHALLHWLKQTFCRRLNLVASGTREREREREKLIESGGDRQQWSAFCCAIETKAAEVCVR